AGGGVRHRPWRPARLAIDEFSGVSMGLLAGDGSGRYKERVVPEAPIACRKVAAEGRGGQRGPGGSDPFHRPRRLHRDFARVSARGFRRARPEKLRALTPWIRGILF